MAAHIENASALQRNDSVRLADRGMEMGYSNYQMIMRDGMQRIDQRVLRYRIQSCTCRNSSHRTLATSITDL